MTFRAAAFGPPTMGLDYNNATIPVQVPLTLTVQTGVGNEASIIVLNGSACTNLQSLTYSNFQFIYTCSTGIICIDNCPHPG